MADLQVQVLGKLRLWNAATVVDRFPTRRVEELLAFLLFYQHREHSREKLIDLLWPDQPPANGRASLSTALWRMGKVFKGMGVSPAGFVHTNRDWIKLSPVQPFIVDAMKFESYLDQAEVEEDAGKRVDQLRKAAAEYRGVFCEGIYSEWCIIERERLERRYLWALGMLMANLIQRQAFEEAVNFGDDILRKDPLREEVHRALMFCHWKLGNTVGSIRQFQLCARLMQDELGILPLPETLDLHLRIVEDRVSAILDGAQGGEYQQLLRSAFDKFQSAAVDLESLLKKGESGTSVP